MPREGLMWLLLALTVLADSSRGISVVLAHAESLQVSVAGSELAAPVVLIPGLFGSAFAYRTTSRWTRWRGLPGASCSRPWPRRRSRAGSTGGGRSPRPSRGRHDRRYAGHRCDGLHRRLPRAPARGRWRADA